MRSKADIQLIRILRICRNHFPLAKFSIRFPISYFPTNLTSKSFFKEYV